MNEMKKKQINKKLLIIILVVIILPLLFFVPSTDSDKQPDENVMDSTSQKTEKFEVGEFCYLTDNCFGFVDFDDLGKVIDILKADDKTGMMEMVASKKATTLAAGKRVKIVKIKCDYIQVRDVDASELLIWVPSSMLTHEDIYDMYGD